MLLKGEALMGGDEELREHMGRWGGRPLSACSPQKAASGFACSFGLALSGALREGPNVTLKVKI